MNIKLACIFPLLLSPLALSACSHTEAGKAPSQFGSSVRQNIAAQIVNPDAPDTDAPIDYNGNRVSLAQKRYATDTVEKVDAAKTSSASSSGSSQGQ